MFGANSADLASFLGRLWRQPRAGETGAWVSRGMCRVSCGYCVEIYGD